MKVKLYGVLVACVLLGGSCKKKQDDIGPDACSTASQRATAFEQAVTNYGTSQTKANCDAVKSTGNAFLDAAARCSTVSQSDVSEARTELNQLTCN